MNTRASTTLRAVARRGRRLAAIGGRRLPGTSAAFGPIRRWAPDAAAWVASWNRRGGDRASYVELDHPGVVTRRPPTLVTPGADWQRLPGNPDGRLGPPGEHHPIPATFVVELPDGRVIGAGGVVVTPDDAVLVDASHAFVHDQRHHPIRVRWRFGPPTEVDGVVGVVAANYGWTYYHWMFDVLPRIELLRRAGYDVARLDALAVNEIWAPFQSETLERMGAPRLLDVRRDGSTHLQAHRLVVPSTVGESGVPPLWAGQFLRGLFADALRPCGERLLYLRRGEATSRRVHDEDRLVDALEARGFEAVTCDRLSVADQAQLLSSAAVVIAPHGGSVANTVFCRPGTTVFELFPETFVNPVYWALANQIGLDYWADIHQAVASGPDAVPGSHDMVVDADRVARAVDAILTSSFATPAVG